MYSLVDYSSSDDSSDAPVEQLCTSVGEARTGAAGPPVIADTAASTTTDAPIVDQQISVKQPIPSTVRQFAHVPGQWALTVMLTVEPMPTRDVLEDFCSRVSSLVRAKANRCVASSDPGEDTMSQSELDHGVDGKDCHHVSLSRTQPATFAQRKTLIQGLRQACGDWHPRPMRLNSLQVFSNDSATRTFLAVLPDGGAPDIVHLIQRVDRVMLRHRLQHFYSDPQPHVSLLWWSGDVTEAVQQRLPQLQEVWGSLVGSWCCQRWAVDTESVPDRDIAFIRIAPA